MSNDLPFFPYSTSLRFLAPEPQDSQSWQKILGAYLQILARDCTVYKPSFIGHIKAFANLPDNGFLKLSLVDAARPVNVTGDLRTATQAITMDINIHIFGVTTENIDSAITQRLGSFSPPHSSTEIQVNQTPRIINLVIK